MKIFAAYNPNSQVRHESSAGGVFSMLAQDILNRGGIVYGAAFDDYWHVVHSRVDTTNALSFLRGSKYAFSDFTGALKQVQNDINKGCEVLFSGTPCQIATIDKLIGDNKLLLKVEVVCHGAPKPEYWTRYLDELCVRNGKTMQDISSINFRDKSTGWKEYSFTVNFSDGTEFSEIHDDNLYMRAFLADLTLRDACFRCPFKYPDGTRADITLGDFWGISQLAPEADNNLGTTIILSRTALGDDALSRAGLEVSDQYSLDDVSRYNPAITGVVPCPASRDAFERAATPGHLIAAMKRYASRPLRQRLKLMILRGGKLMIHKGK